MVPKFILIHTQFEFLTDKTSNKKQPLCRNSFLYFISTPSNHLLPHFWFYLRYKNKSTFWPLHAMFQPLTFYIYSL